MHQTNPNPLHFRTVHPVARMEGAVQLPADKSISHRAALFSAIAEGEQHLENYSNAADPQSTLDCLRRLGVSVHQEGSSVIIGGVGKHGFKTPDEPLDCGNSGTTMRLLTGLLAGSGTPSTLIGDASLSARPMKRILEPLRMMGCKVSATDDNYAPIRVEPHEGIRGIEYPLPVASAQLKSCLLLAGLYAEEPTIILESRPTRDHTERNLCLPTHRENGTIRTESSAGYNIPSQSGVIPGDFSAAAFWMVAATLHPGSNLTLSNTGINPSRTALLTLLQSMGADIRLKNKRTSGREPVADLEIRGAMLKAVTPDPSVIPNCIDELPVLMVAMAFAEGTSVIRGAEELRFKETDRLAAMEEVLAHAGCKFRVRDDGIEIEGNPEFTPKSARYNSYDDHRIAMASAILATRSGGVSQVLHPDCVAISYPGFWTDLDRVGRS